jgi:hypothetical protein
MHFYGWKAGLKTGCYYLRTKAPVTAQKFTVDPRLLAAVQGSTHQAVEADSDDESVSDSESEDEQQQKAPLSPKSARRAKLEELARAYEESVQELKDRKARGEEVCEMCSS